MTGCIAAQDAFLALDEKISGSETIEASIALLRLGEAIFERYETAKRARAALDFDDLIGKTLEPSAPPGCRRMGAL